MLEDLKAEVIKAIRRHPPEGKESLNLYVQDGIVEIGGKLNSEFHRDKLLKSISDLQGVREIKSSIDLLSH
jgi:hypothetical protein